MNLRETYNKIARDWHRDHTVDDWWKEGTEKFVSFLQSGNTVLDIGCGTGIKAHYLQKRGLSVTGIDFSEEMIQIARETTPEVDFHVLDFFQAGTLDRKFDGLFAQAALLHVPKKDLKDLIAELSELIHPGGYFYIAVKAKSPDRMDEEIVKENDYGYEYERFFSYSTQEEIESYLKNCGHEIVFTDVWKNSYGISRWVQVIGKKVK